MKNFEDINKLKATDFKSRERFMEEEYLRCDHCGLESSRIFGFGFELLCEHCFLALLAQKGKKNA